jgi:hypothetical protein
MDLAETVARLTSLMSSYLREFDLLSNEFDLLSNEFDLLSNGHANPPHAIYKVSNRRQRF